MTTRESLCDAVMDALLDPSGAPPPGMDGHLAACASCRRVRDAHRAAERLGPRPIPGAPAIRMEELVARVGSRRRRRAAVGTAAVAACALVALALLAPAPDERRGRREDLFAVADSVGDYARRELAAEDPVLLAAAPLAGWLSPPRRGPVDLSSFAPPPRLGASAGGPSQ